MRALITALTVLSLTVSAVVINGAFVSDTVAEAKKTLLDVSESFGTDRQRAIAKSRSLSESFEKKCELLSLSFKETELQPLQSALVRLSAACEHGNETEFDASLKTAFLLCESLERAEGLSFYNIF